MVDLNFFNEELKKISFEIEKNKELLKSEDQNIVLLAQEEIERLKKREREIKEKIFQSKNNHQELIIMEIRSGVGGKEAELWAKDLFEIYFRFAKKQGWKLNILEAKESDQGGFKEVILEIKGRNVFEILKYEGGVHRVQRVPKTERQGRIHTSTATVAVLKQPTETELKINPSDLSFSYKKASGSGGQYVNKRMTAVRITHLPTGLTVDCQSERSQLQNKEMALKILRARLYQLKEEKIRKEIAQERKKQIGQAKRTEKIRTYNFQENRITDHRLKKNWKNLDRVMEGELSLILAHFKSD
ncbi:MAG: PCRF domain-containing protein [Minisyncoccales bacterium]